MPMLLPSVFLAAALSFVNSLFRGCDSRRTVARQNLHGFAIDGPQNRQLRTNTLRLEVTSDATSKGRFVAGKQDRA